MKKINKAAQKIFKEFFYNIFNLIHGKIEGVVSSKDNHRIKTLESSFQKTNKYKVLLIEAGGKDTYPWIHIPVGYYKTMHNPKTDWCFKTEPDESMENVSIPYPRGKTLGGS